MNDSANAGGTAPEGAVKSYKRDFWIKENQKQRAGALPAPESCPSCQRYRSGSGVRSA